MTEIFKLQHLIVIQLKCSAAFSGILMLLNSMFMALLKLLLF